MQVGMVGLGRMGANMAERLRRAGHEIVGYDREPGQRDVASMEDLVAALSTPRAVWVMVPAGDPTRETLERLGDLLDRDDVVVDGGNSHYVDDATHSAQLAEKGVGFVDAGVSGGVWGLENGYALMVGGAAEHVALLRPAFDALKPPGEHGYVHAGKPGAGHFAKMVHNGIEYALMQSYAEGYELLAAADAVEDVPAVLASWQTGTVVRSWLLDLLVRALDEDPELARLRGYAEDSGEGRWTVQAAVDHAVPAPAISAALFARFGSRQEDSPSMKVIAALRHQFGGHAVAAADPAGDGTGGSPGQ